MLGRIVRSLLFYVRSESKSSKSLGVLRGIFCRPQSLHHPVYTENTSSLNDFLKQCFMFDRRGLNQQRSFPVSLDCKELVDGIPYNTDGKKKSQDVSG